MKTPTTAVAAIPAELLDTVKTSGIELTKSEAYALSFAPFMQQVNEASQQAAAINKEQPTPEDAAKARKLRLALVPNRTAAEKEKDRLKANLLNETNLIQSLYNVVKNTSALIESELMEVEKYQERIEAERKAKLKAEREEALAPYVDNVALFPLADMEQAAFEQLLQGQKLAYEARIEAERKAEEARIEAARLEAERIEQQRLENERLKKEAAEREAQLEKERQAAAAKQAAIEAEARKEREALEAKLKAEKDAAEKAQREAKAKQEEIERIERERIAEEKRKEADRIAAEKKAAAAPDKEKLQAFKDKLQALEIPTLVTPEAAIIAANIKVLVDKIAAYIDEKSASI